MNKCDYQKSNCDCGSSSSGFVFGLILGAIIGAVIAVVIYKNNKSEVFEKLEKRIKEFFENLIPQNESKTASPQPSKSSPLKSKPPVKKIIAAKPVVETKPSEITPVFVKPKKPTPKMFIKPKK